MPSRTVQRHPVYHGGSDAQKHESDRPILAAAWRFALSFFAAALAVALLVSTALADTPTQRPELPQPEEVPMLFQPSPIGDIEYRPGRGLKLGDTAFTLGGFGTVRATRLDHMERPASIVISGS